MAVEITAAIIAAIAASATSAATTAATISADQLSRSGSAINQAGIIENLTHVKFDLIGFGKPLHGKWYKPPTNGLSAMPRPNDILEAWQKSGKAPESSISKSDVSQLSEGEALLLENWIEKDLEFDDHIQTIQLASIGAGVEAVAFYQNIPRDFAFAVLLDNPKSGSVCAGVTINRCKWIKNIMESGDQETYEDTIDHIRKAMGGDGDNYTQVAEGQSKKVMARGISITVTGTEEARFVISE